MKGVDISHYQKGLTIQQIQDAGNGFAIIKLTEGTSYVDPSAFEFYKEAYEIDFPVGCYCYSHALNAQQAMAEAAFLMDTIRGFPMPCGIYIDIERDDQLALPKNELKNIILGWCAGIGEHGYVPGVYGSEGALWAKVDANSLPTGTLVWVAKWSSNAPNTPCDLWQNSDHGTIPGYDGPVDTDEVRSQLLKGLIEIARTAPPEDVAPLASDACSIGGCNKGDNKMAHVITMLQTAMYFTGYWGTPDGNSTPEFKEAFKKFVEEVCV